MRWQYWRLYNVWLLLMLSSTLLLSLCLVESRRAWAGESSKGQQKGTPAACSEAEVRWKHLVKQALPAVVRVASVSVVTMRHERQQGFLSTDPFLPSAMLQEEQEAQQNSRQGSGVLVSPDGYVVTTYHVIEKAEEIFVTLHDDREFQAQLVDTDPVTDLAILKLPGQDFPSVPFGDFRHVEIADPVVAIGDPFGLGLTVTKGIVSGVRRAQAGLTFYDELIQTDAAINPGNSGGALLNSCGQLIGIVTAMAALRGDATGVGFAVPVNIVQAVFEQVRTSGRVRYGWFGIVLQEFTPELARGLAIPEIGGVLVSDVVQGGPAAQAGIQRGDVLLQCGGVSVHTLAEMRHRIAQSVPGTQVRLKVYRHGEERLLTLRVGDLPEVSAPQRAEEHAETELDDLGMVITDLTLALASRLEMPLTTRGVVITEVFPDGLAQQAGLASGDVIQEVNRQVVRSVQDLRGRLEHATDASLVFLVNRRGTTWYALVDRTT
jgi:serine protease Do